MKTTDMIKRFPQEAQRASETAKRANANVLLLVFCHSIASQFLLDSRSNTKGLLVQQLKGVVEPGACITLVSAACYSDGWIVYPDLNYTTMAAAGTGTTSTAWPDSYNIGRACGSIFASSLIETLSSTASEL